MDFITSIGVLLMAFLFAVYTISGVMTPFGGYSKALYPEADRVSSLLIEDEGYWTDGHDAGTDWNAVWPAEPDHVKKIGFRKSQNTSLIDTRKLLFMQEHKKPAKGSWWEFPSPTTNQQELDNVSRALGLERYQFYMQVRPLDKSTFNTAEADAGARYLVDGKDDVVAVTRLVMVEHTTFGDFNGSIIAGHSENDFLITIETSEFDVIKDGISLTISKWMGNGSFENLKIGDFINSNYEITSSGGHSSGSLDNDGKWYYVYLNGANITDSGEVIINNSNTVRYFMPESTVRNFIPDWDTSGRNLYIEMSFKGDIYITDEGETLFSATEKTYTYPAKITLWVW